MSLTNASPEQAARAAKVSSRKLATLATDAKNAALDAVHDALANARDDILAANAKDVALAKQSAENGELSPAILKRLDLARPGKFDDMLKGIQDVKDLEDPGRQDIPFARFVLTNVQYYVVYTWSHLALIWDFTPLDGELFADEHSWKG